MQKTYSKYKWLGGFGLLFGLNLFLGFQSFKLIMGLESFQNLANWEVSQPTINFMLLNLIFLVFSTKQCRYFILDDTGITSINPILPFLRKQWEDLDYFILVGESASGSSYEAIWVIQNGKIEGRISSFYYTNYEVLKSKMMVKERSGISMTSLDQLLILLGLKRMTE